MNQNEAGFTLVEALVTTAIVAVLGSGLAALSSSFVSVQSRMASADVAAEFTSAFGRYLMTQEGCQSALQGKMLPDPASTPQPISIVGFGAYGSDDPSKSDVVEARTVLGSGLQIASADLQEKAGMRSQLASSSGQETYNHVAIVTIGLDRAMDSAGTVKTHYRPATFELPVVTDSPTGGRILDCRIHWQPPDACAAIGWYWDPVTQQCRPKDDHQCAYTGTYVSKLVQVYFWIYSDTVQAFYLAGTQPASPQDAPPLPSEMNTYTGTTSCPAGSRDFNTGDYLVRLLRVVRHPNGKGEAHLYLYDEYHSCMRCS